LALDPRTPFVMPQGFTDRPREVFRHLVEAFLASGEPVGSRTLSQRLPHVLSPASIRNVMADLEAMGLLYSPHTSAGRIPTEKGLRLFVDGLLEVGELAPDERIAIEARMSGSSQRIHHRREAIVEVEKVHLSLAAQNACDLERGVALVDADLRVPATTARSEELDRAQIGARDVEIAKWICLFEARHAASKAVELTPSTGIWDGCPSAYITHLSGSDDTRE